MDHVHIFMVYRILIVLGGILCIYLGYRLFFVVQTKQGELSIKTGEHQELHLRDVAPGVFFAFFGASILTFCLLNGVTIKTNNNGIEFPDMSDTREIEEQDYWRKWEGWMNGDEEYCMSQREDGCR